MPTRVPVTFAPSGEIVWVETGVTLAEAARSAGVLLATPCAGRGVCGGCGVRVVDGALAPPDEVEQAGLRRAPSGVRLACRAVVNGPIEVRPLFAPEARVASTAATSASVGALGSEPSTARLVAGVDMGTTTVAALLVDAASGMEVARASAPNRQASLGADILSRLSAAQDGCGPELQRLIAESIGEVLGEVVRSGGVATDSIERIVLAGNSAMAALLECADPASLTAHPFTPPVPGGPLGDEARRLIGVPPRSSAVLLAPIAAFVGGDALAATVAAGLVDSDKPALLVDVGTNAELVLAVSGRLLVASTAAGPAFEGVGIACGGPAATGAVTRVRIMDDDVVLTTIGDAPALWLSGSGLVSAAAALRQAGHLGPDGRMTAEGPLRSRFSTDDRGVLGVNLSELGAQLLVLSQLDVRALQLAKAAIRVGVERLMSAANVHASDLDEVLVAGAFGAALEPEDLVELGVLPTASAARTRRIGNAALEGAAALALDPALVALAERAACRAVHVDLADDADFGSAFIRATEFLPYAG
jgi:uncharacterized 2Fe-2S/4Fe-4S cluster protein (DUF4445 family)